MLATGHIRPDPMNSRQNSTQRRLMVILLAGIVSTGLVLVGCSSTSSEPRSALRGASPPADYRLSPQRRELLSLTRALLGTPYRYGGSDTRGFDCSGLVHYVHGRTGVHVPRTASMQWRAARRPARDYLLPGDLVFFSLDGDKSNHVGIYEGDGVFIHAPSAGKRVSRASLDNPYWRRRLRGGRTFL